MKINSREIKNILCSCGGDVKEINTTENECETHGCFRDSPGHVCCVTAMQCDKCKIKFLISLEAPDRD